MIDYRPTHGRFGVFVRKECWTLTFSGKLLALAAVAILLTIGILEAYPFLAVNHPVGADIMVLEGWVPEYTLAPAADAFRNGNYHRLLIARSIDVNDRKSESIQLTLISYGLAPGSVSAIYYPAPRKDRTYHAAVAVRDWLADHEIPTKSVDVVTVGPHARRSRLLFEKAFGKTASVGIIRLDDAMYDSQHWWRTSEGVREVIGEAIAYVYAKFFFEWI